MGTVPIFAPRKWDCPLLKSDQFLAHGPNGRLGAIGHADAAYRVIGAIAQWDTDASGTAVLVVQWECVTDKGTVVIPLKTSRYTAQAAKADNYGDIVKALNQTLSDFAKDVATELRTALP